MFDHHCVCNHTTTWLILSTVQSTYLTRHKNCYNILTILAIRPSYSSFVHAHYVFLVLLMQKHWETDAERVSLLTGCWLSRNQFLVVGDKSAAQHNASTSQQCQSWASATPSVSSMTQVTLQALNNVSKQTSLDELYKQVPYGRRWSNVPWQTVIYELQWLG